jgi:hypothetical protein
MPVSLLIIALWLALVLALYVTGRICRWLVS